MERKTRAILLGLLLLMGAAALMLLLDAQVSKGRRAEEIALFQRATGGLGMGAIATPSWQFINYDSRVVSVDDSITWPLPGAYSFGPDRTATVSYFEDAPDDDWRMVDNAIQEPAVRGNQ